MIGSFASSGERGTCAFEAGGVFKSRTEREYVARPCGGGTRESRLTSEDLVEEDLDVVGGERLRRHDHFVEVALHQLCYHVAAGGEQSRKKNKTHAHARTDLRLHEHNASPGTGLRGGGAPGRSGKVQM